MSKLVEQWQEISKQIIKRFQEGRSRSVAYLRQELAELRDDIVSKFYTNKSDVRNRSLDGTGRRTGTAARGWRSMVKATGQEIVGRIYNNVKHADQRKERTIRPKSSRHLAVPIGKALTPTGQKRYSGPMDARIRDKLTAIKRRGKPTLLVRETEGGRRKIDLYFVLLKSVKIPARHAGLNKFADDRVEKIRTKFLTLRAS